MPPRAPARDWTNVKFVDYDLIRRRSPGDRTRDRTLEGGWLMPSDYTVVVDDPDLPALVTLAVTVHNHRLAAARVDVRRRRGGPPVDGDTLRRVPLAAYVQRSLQMAPDTLADDDGVGLLVAQVDTGPGRLSFKAVGPAGTPAHARAIEAAAEGHRRPKSEVLADVVQLYREALRSRDPDVNARPTQYVADRLHYARGHASRLLTEARRAGLLDAAHRGRGGERRTPTTDQDTDPTDDQTIDQKDTP